MLQCPLLTEDRLEFARHGPAQLDIDNSRETSCLKFVNVYDISN